MAGSSSNVKIVPLDPEYIQFLLDPDLGFSCYFVVGNAELAPVVKIGVVKKMLAAHSNVFRAQLLNRQWESKEPEEITDILPATFRNLLRFVYGFDTTAAMSFEDADDLMYAADRYIMQKLKDKLATRLMSLLDYTNICSLLTNPACATALELHSEMTKILQCETDKVLGSAQFLSCSPDTFVKILEQEVMNITELEVWRAALRWAKNKVQREDGETLRQQLEMPLHHIRVCSLSADEFCKEVVPTGVLSENEVGAVCNTIVTKKKSKTLTRICNNMQVRRVTTSRSLRDGGNQGLVDCVKSQELTVDLSKSRVFNGSASQLSFSLQTHALAVELTRLACYIVRKGEFTVTVKIESTQGTSTTVTHTGNHAFCCKDTIQVSTEERPVVLLPNTKYSITLSSHSEFFVWVQARAVETLEHFTEEFPQCSGRCRGSPVLSISYKTLTPQ